MRRTRAPSKFCGHWLSWGSTATCSPNDVEEPDAWGLLLADFARHAGKAHAAEGVPEGQGLDRTLQLFHREFAAPTDTPS
ncbi:DUF5076 domain-containing protein [Mesorhizobium sp. SARCC-RB16n]|uniref:DUF5076 domain-containing protein n=1 Tax=Mesorhizobium sp. SARCC-RB16n TaxID=2116687 RepID=UPI00358F5A20